MNLILLDSESPVGEFPREDRRYTHIRRILRGKVGTTLKAGVVNGFIGVLEITEISEQSITYYFSPTEAPNLPYPIEVIIGAMRPIVARRLLKDLTSLGVGGIRLVKADLSEGSYLESSLWKNREYESYLREGAEQGGTTILPTVRLYTDLRQCLEEVSKEGRNLVMDPDAPTSFLSVQQVWGPSRNKSMVLRVAIGPERGWTEREMGLFIESGFIPCRLGARVLRTEAAALIAVGILAALWEASPTPP